MIPVRRREARLQKKMNRQRTLLRWLIVGFFALGATGGLLYYADQWDPQTVTDTLQNIRTRFFT